MLSLCRPIMSDPSKIKKIDWRFLLAKDPNVTVLVKAPTSSSSRHRPLLQVKGGSHISNPRSINLKPLTQRHPIFDTHPDITHLLSHPPFTPLHPSSLTPLSHPPPPFSPPASLSCRSSCVASR